MDKTTLEDVKRLAAELLKALPTVKSLESLQAGMKCLGIAYLEMVGEPWEQAIAVSVYDFAIRKAGNREIDLLLAARP